MNTMLTVIVVIQVLSALTIIGLVLLQHGKGADMGAAFGSGASGSLFGATGSSNFVSKSTGVAAAVFFACTLALSYIATNRHSGGNNTGGGVMDSVPVTKAPASAKASAPVAPTGVGSASAAIASVPASSAASAASAASTNQVPK